MVRSTGFWWLNSGFDLADTPADKWTSQLRNKWPCGCAIILSPCSATYPLIIWASVCPITCWLKAIQRQLLRPSLDKNMINFLFSYFLIIHSNFTSLQLLPVCSGGDDLGMRRKQENHRTCRNGELLLGDELSGSRSLSCPLNLMSSSSSAPHLVHPNHVLQRKD